MKGPRPASTSREPAYRLPALRATARRLPLGYPRKAPTGNASLDQLHRFSGARLIPGDARSSSDSGAGSASLPSGAAPGATCGARDSVPARPAAAARERAADSRPVPLRRRPQSGRLLRRVALHAVYCWSDGRG